MRIVGELLIYNIIGWIGILFSIFSMYGIFQCKIKEVKKIYIKTIILIEILLLTAIGIYILFPSKKIIWINFLIIGFLAACFLYKGNWLKKVFVYSLGCIIQYYLKELILLFRDMIFGKSILRNNEFQKELVLFVFCIVIVWGISMIIRRNSFLCQKIEEIPLEYFGIFIVNGICSSILYYRVKKVYVIDKTNIFNSMLVLGTIIIFFLMILSSFVIAFIGKSRKHFKEQIQLKEEYIEMQKEYYDTTFQADQSMRKISYDITTNLRELKGLIEKRKFEETIQYLGYITDKIDKVRGNLFRTNRPMVDALLNRLANEAKEERVELKLTGGFGEKLIIDDYHLCRIFYHSIMCGIQACRKVKNESQRIISIEIGRFKNSLDLKITNALHENLVIKETKLGITQEHIKNHGYAIGNLKDAVEQYDGIIEFYTQGKLFLVEIVFLEAY